VGTGSLVMQSASTPSSASRHPIRGASYITHALDNTYQGTARVELNVNNLHLEIRRLVLITSP
jgi:hypothetical protein